MSSSGFLGATSTAASAEDKRGHRQRLKIAAWFATEVNTKEHIASHEC